MDKAAKVETTRGIISLGAVRKAKTSDFSPPDGWKLYSRDERLLILPDTTRINGFYERWVHPSSKSGIITYSTFDEKDNAVPYGYRHLAGEIYYAVEGYGIGTIEPRKFKETGGFAPIEHTEHSTIEDARLALRYLMEDDVTLIGGGPCLARQPTVAQVEKA